MKAIAFWPIRKPIWAVLLAFSVVAVSGFGLSRLSADFTFRGYYKADNPYIQEFDNFERIFGGDERLALVIHSPSGVFDIDSAKLVQDLTQKMWQVPDVIRVESITNYNWIHGNEDEVNTEPFFDEYEEVTEEFLAQRKPIAMKDEVIQNYLLSKDGKTTVVFAILKPLLGKTPNFAEGIFAVRKMMDEYKGRTDHQFYLSGTAMINQAIKETSEKDLQKVIVFLSIVMTTLLLLIFKTKTGLFLPMMVNSFTVVSTLGLAGWLGIQFNSITSGIGSILTAIVMANSMHILVGFYRSLEGAKENVEAVYKTFEKNFLPVLLTSLSTSFGFFSLSFSELLPLSGLGILGGSGVLFAWLYTMLLLGPGLQLSKKKGKGRQPIHFSRDFLESYIDWLERNKKGVLLSFLLIAVTACFLATQNKISSNPLKYLAPTVPFRIATEFMEENLGGAAGPQIVLDSQKENGVKDPVFAEKVNQLQSWMAEKPFVSKTISYVDIIKKVNRAMNSGDQEFYNLPKTQAEISEQIFFYTLSLPEGMGLNDQISFDQSQARIKGFWTLHDSAKILDEIDAIEAKAKELGLNAKVTGKAPIYDRMNGYVVDTFFTSVLSALVLISLFLVLVFKSLRLGLLSLIPNVMPLMIGGGFMFIVGKPLDIGTVLVCAICLGIAVDDTIHFLSSFAMYREKKEKREALISVLSETGAALTGTTLILVLGFGTFLLGEFVPNFNLGLISAVILVFALILDLILLPALILQSKKF